MVPYCEECGTKLSDRAKFCSECGLIVEKITLKHPPAATMQAKALQEQDVSTNRLHYTEILKEIENINLISDQDNDKTETQSNAMDSEIHQNPITKGWVRQAIKQENEVGSKTQRHQINHPRTISNNDQNDRPNCKNKLVNELNSSDSIFEKYVKQRMPSKWTPKIIAPIVIAALAMVILLIFEMNTGYFRLSSNEKNTLGLLQISETSQQVTVKKAVALMKIGDKAGVDYVNRQLLTEERDVTIAILKELTRQNVKASLSDDLFRTHLMQIGNKSRYGSDLAKAYADYIVQMVGVDAAYKIMVTKLSEVMNPTYYISLQTKHVGEGFQNFDKAIKNTTPLIERFDTNRRDKLRALETPINNALIILNGEYKELDNEKSDNENKLKRNTDELDKPIDPSVKLTFEDLIPSKSKGYEITSRRRILGERAKWARESIQSIKQKIDSLEGSQWKPVMNELRIAWNNL